MRKSKTINRNNRKVKKTRKNLKNKNVINAVAIGRASSNASAIAAAAERSIARARGFY